MLFSIIIPVYNVEKYIHKCLESVIKQYDENFEVLLIDDGSTDASPLICQQYAIKYDFIKVVHKKNGGLSDARNIGIFHARGEYCLFLDSDDWLNDKAILSLKQIIKRGNHPDVIVNRIMVYDDILKTVRECRYYFNYKQLRRLSVSKAYNIIQEQPDFWGTAWMLVVRRNYIKQKRLYFVKGLIYEDEQWTPKVILNSKNMKFNNYCIYYSRGNRENSITSKTDIKHALSKLWIIDNLYQESLLPKYKKIDRQIYQKRCAKLYINVLLSLKKYNKTEQKKIMKELYKRKKLLLCGKKLKYYIVFFFINMIG